MTSSFVAPTKGQTGPGSQRPAGKTRTTQVGMEPPPAGAAAAVVARVEAVELAVCEALRPFTLPSLRILLGVLFIWFGALKVTGTSPVEALVSGTLPWLDPKLAVVGLGGVEVMLGLGLVTGLLLRAVLPVLAAHLAGTFLTFIMLPGLMVSDDNPLLLTEPGEFVVKNLVLISAALVLMTHNRRSSMRP
jgi:putative oxidoreductase